MSFSEPILADRICIGETALVKKLKVGGDKTRAQIESFMIRREPDGFHKIGDGKATPISDHDLDDAVVTLSRPSLKGTAYRVFLRLLEISPI